MSRNFGNQPPTYAAQNPKKAKSSTTVSTILPIFTPCNFCTYLQIAANNAILQLQPADVIFDAAGRLSDDSIPTPERH